jgi:hypothetical protein
LPKNLNSIGDECFEHCKSLNVINLPANLKVLGSKAFSSSGLISIDIPSKIEKLEQKTFAYCENLNKVNLPKDLKKIGRNCFEGCNSLKSITIPNKVSNLSVEIFKDCKNLTNIEMPDGLEEIPTKAFYNCPSLVSIKLPSSTTIIKSSAFARCLSLTKINLDKVLKIGHEAFLDCKHLSNVSLSSDLEELENYVFFGCPINYIELPSRLKRIEFKALSCRALNNVKWNGITYDDEDDFNGALNEVIHFEGFFNINSMKNKQKVWVKETSMDANFMPKSVLF